MQKLNVTARAIMMETLHKKYKMEWNLFVEFVILNIELQICLSDTLFLHLLVFYIHNFQITN